MPAATPKISGEFYAVNNRGIFCSIDSGISWKMLDEHDGIHWPKEYLSQHPKDFSSTRWNIDNSKIWRNNKN